MTPQRKKIAGVMGWPVSHSLSPRLHGYWIEKYGLAAEYHAWPVEPHALAETLKRLAETCAAAGDEFRGANLTIPLKEKAFEIVDIIDDSAKRIGAVNTIVVGSDGRLTGYNTDGTGFRDSLGEKVDLAPLKGGTAVLLGAGGAARAVAVALIDLGMARVYLCNRSRARAEALAGHLGSVAAVADWEMRETLLQEADLLVNCTSLGMTGQPPLDLSLDGLKNSAIVSDIVYVPLETGLLKAARARGNVAVDGLGMLLHQAKAGFQAWFGVKPEVTEDLRRHVLAGIKR